MNDPHCTRHSHAGSPLSPVVDAATFGVHGDGRQDDTRAIQSALDACGRDGGGYVLLPPGQFALHGTLTIPPHVTLRGSSGAPAASGEGHGSSLHAYAGRGTENGHPAIAMLRGSGLQAMTVLYPEQTGDSITPYPYCIGGDGEDISVTDCMLVNPYQGIDFGSKGCPRHFVSRVYGYPLRRGLFVDQCFDIGRIEHVHFWPFWRSAANPRAVRAFVQQHGEAFVFAMTDWQYVLNTFCWGYRTGYRFTENGLGVCNGNFLGIGADACNVCVQVDNCAAYGLLITNGEFVAIDGPNPTPIVVGPDYSGTVQFNNCSTWGPCHQCARIEGKGYVSFSQCHFLEWDSKQGTAPAIDVKSGTVNVHGSRFSKAASSIRIGSKVRGAVVTGNLFAASEPVTVEPGATATVEANGVQAPREEAIAGSCIVDVMGADTRVDGEWWDFAGRGTYGGVGYFSVQREETSSFTWYLRAARPGTYTVAAWIPRWVAPVRGHGEAHYHIAHADGETPVSAIQSEHAESWLTLGTYEFNADSCVTLQNAPGAAVLADCLLLTPAPRSTPV